MAEPFGFIDTIRDTPTLTPSGPPEGEPSASGTPGRRPNVTLGEIPREQLRRSQRRVDAAQDVARAQAITVTVCDGREDVVGTIGSKRSPANVERLIASIRAWPSR